MQTPTSLPGVRIERVVTAGGGLENNVWLLGNDREVLVVDAAWDAAAILDAIAGRTVVAIVCTHAHHDHVNAVEELRAATGAPVWLNPADAELWQQTVSSAWDDDLTPETIFEVAGTRVFARHTPGHTQGSTCLHVPDLTTIFTGDTLFKGGPGATRWEYSNFAQIIQSISENLLSLPPETVVLTGHGESTSIEVEAPDLPEWVARGW